MRAAFALFRVVDDLYRRTMDADDGYAATV